MRLEDYPKEPRFDAAVLSNERITDAAAEEVRELVLAIDRPDFEYEIGQCIGVLSEGPAEFGGSLHHRLYSVASAPGAGAGGKPEVTIVVKRCNYIDEYSGEEYRGTSSNYLCDLTPGQHLSITGPFGIPFKIPPDPEANLLLIGMGTGIAPFRGLVKHIYEDHGEWKGKVTLLYGAHTGLELLYMNEHRDDFTKYYDEETFEAFKALSPRPSWADPIAWDYALEERASEIWNRLSEEHTFVYVAGLKAIRDHLDELFGDMCGSPESWQAKKQGMIDEGRWVELLY
ncbi:MAG: hypothetical protein QNJ40_06145 [Xanthomonadales bacterium]|nr:hypothetical protein [Xanthomonadales bacterium]